MPTPNHIETLRLALQRHDAENHGRGFTSCKSTVATSVNPELVARCKQAIEQRVRLAELWMDEYHTLALAEDYTRMLDRAIGGPR